MTTPGALPTFAGLQRKARAMYRDAEKRDQENRARGGSALPSFSIMRGRHAVAAVRPAVEYALMRRRKPSLAVIAGAARYIAGRRLLMHDLRDLGLQMGYCAQGKYGHVLVGDHVEKWTASVIAAACVIVASGAKPRDATDAHTRMGFVLDCAWRLPERYRAAAMRRISADTRALLWCDRRSLPLRDQAAAKRRHDKERRAAERAGRYF